MDGLVPQARGASAGGGFQERAGRAGMEHLRCVVERITYQNTENGFSVLKCRAKGYRELVTVVGSMPDVHVGSVLYLGGAWKIDGKYGRQFSMEIFEEVLPATAYGIEKYLGSGLVKGVGPKFAGRIVKKFGADTLNIIEEDPDRLLEVEGIGKVRVERIRKSWQEQKEIKNIMLFLQGHDVSTSHATKIFKTYGNESIKVVQENPYRLADDIWGIGFRTADTIAEKMGFGHEKYVRLRSGILYTLNRLAEDGHCYATREMLLKTGAELLSVEDYVLSMTLDEMIRVNDVITELIPSSDNEGFETVASLVPETSATLSLSAGKEAALIPAPADGKEAALAPASTDGKAAALAPASTDGKEAALAPASMDGKAAAIAPADVDVATFTPIAGRADILAREKAIYLPPFFFSEAGTARRLFAICRSPGGVYVDMEGLLERISLRTGMHYDEVQLEAIRTAVRSKALVLTGGPGTGKTTTTLGIITAFREAGAKILLAAPTGRAAKRLSEATGMEAKTIHRLLEAKPPEGYQKNDENPLEGDVLIVDECSMIDIMLMYNLLKAVPNAMTLILVGDTDQLPSVGPGNVLRDIIASGIIPVIRLTRIFRQAQESRIIMNAHRINSGRMPDISNGAKSDFFFMDMEQQAKRKGLDSGDGAVLAEEAAKTITELVSVKLPRYYKVPVSEVQVLSPMQRGVVGAANLNQVLQQVLNPGGEGLRRGGILFKAGDKVMQIRNNYDKEVFNGDIGVVGSVDTEERELTVNFDGKMVSYDISELDELTLAYATTIHKSQGSEYPVVVIPVLMSHYVMLQRNLVYTGITRAKKVLVLVGTKKALSCAIGNVSAGKRNTMLKERLVRSTIGNVSAGKRNTVLKEGAGKPTL